MAAVGMTRTEALGRLVKWGGRAIVLLAATFLAWTAHKHWAALANWKFTPETGALILLTGAIYGVAMMFIAESWHHIISGTSGATLSRFTTWPSFGVTQVAKYLPGNVFHYVGRHIWLKRQGVTHRAALTGTVWEIALMSASALGCAAIVLMISPIDIGAVPATQVSVVSAILLGALLLGLLVVVVVRRRAPSLAEFIPREPSLIRSPLALMVFFGLQGAAFCLLFWTIGARPPIGAAAIAILAWLVGYVTPGAPGGIGSREAVIVALATPLTSPADALILAGLFRVVTTLGDLVCFAISSLFARGSPDRVVEPS